MSLIFDFETRSPVDLLNRGVYVYVEHPETDALLASFKMSEPSDLWTGPEGICRWKRGEPCPSYLRDYVEAGGEICAHNAAFERLIWWHVMVPKHGWPKPKLEQFRCTAATAAAMSLPRSLDSLGNALGLTIKKDRSGSDLIKIHSIPLGFDTEGEALWHPLADDPTSLEAFHRYCDIDVLSEEEAHHRLIPLSDYEMEVYWLNERINDRGLRIDVRSAYAALELAEKSKAEINKKLYELTDGAVPAVTLTARMKEWVHSKGVPIAAMDKDEIDETLAQDLPDDVRKALELRIEGGKSSVEKIAGMLRSVTRDGTIKGVFLHHGAGQSGRFSSRGGVQVHNMPRPRKVFEDSHIRRDVLFNMIRTGDPEVLHFVYGDILGRPLHLLADALRSFIWAAPNHRFIGGDFSSIEGRIAAWYGREEWKLNAYRALDAGTGFGLYEVAAAGIYNIPVQSVSKQQRQVGKVSELALGFGGGVGALSRMARANKLDLASVYPTLWEITDAEGRERADERYEGNKARGDSVANDLTREAYIAAELIKTAWRARHPGTVNAWRSLIDAAFKATQNPELAVETGLPYARYIVKHGFLWLQLPSGRCLAYGMPEIRDVEVPWANKNETSDKREKQPAVTVRGVGANNAWTRYPLNISICYNNLVQATARDLLVHAMLNVEKHGYPVRLHVHDEIVAEVPHGFGSVEEFEQLMCEAPEWAKRLPLAASGFTLKRYAKT